MTDSPIFEAQEWTAANDANQSDEAKRIRRQMAEELLAQSNYDLAESLTESHDSAIAQKRAGYDGMSPFNAAHGRAARN